MQVRVHPQEDGAYTIGVMKTRPSEGPSILERDIPADEFETTLARMVNQVAAPAQLTPA